MRKVNPNKNPMVGNFLWWLAFWIVVVGAGFIVLIERQSIGSSIEDRSKLVGLITIVGAGLCIISATAKRWMKH